MSKSVLETYDPKEELFNAYSHGAGVVMAVIASILLIIKGSYLSTAQWVGLWVYSFSLILVFTSSTLYHFTYCALEHCCNWYTFQVSFYSSFSENLFARLCSYGVACRFCNG